MKRETYQDSVKHWKYSEKCMKLFCFNSLNWNKELKTVFGESDLAFFRLYEISNHRSTEVIC